MREYKKKQTSFSDLSYLLCFIERQQIDLLSIKSLLDKLINDIDTEVSDPLPTFASQQEYFKYQNEQIKPKYNIEQNVHDLEGLDDRRKTRSGRILGKNPFNQQITTIKAENLEQKQTDSTQASSFILERNKENENKSKNDQSSVSFQENSAQSASDIYPNNTLKNLSLDKKTKIEIELDADKPDQKILKDKEDDQKPTEKKINRKKKIKKTKKRFCISQNQSLNQTSSQDEGSVLSKTEEESMKKISTQSNNILTQEIQLNSSIQREKHSSSRGQQKYEFDSTPKNDTRKILNEMFSNYHQKNNQSDSFLKVSQCSYSQNYPFTSEQKKTPSPFLTVDNVQNDLQQHSSYQKFNYFNQDPQYTIMKKNNYIEHFQTSYNQDQFIVRETPFNKNQIKEENLEEISSNNLESFSNTSQPIKKSKKFPSVIFIEGSKKFQCQICQKTFDSKQKLGGHKARSHPDAPCQRTEREEKKKKKIQDAEATTPTESNTIDTQIYFNEKQKPVNSNKKDFKYQFNERNYSPQDEKQNNLFKNYNSNQKLLQNQNQNQYQMKNDFSKYQYNNYPSFQQKNLNRSQFDYKFFGSQNSQPQIQLYQSFQEEMCYPYLKQRSQQNSNRLNEGTTPNTKSSNYYLKNNKRNN